MSKTVEPVAPGEVILEKLEELDLYQQDLARMSGMTGKHVCHVVNGKVPLSYLTALKIEKAIGLSAAALLHLEVDYRLSLIRRTNWSGRARINKSWQ